MYRLRPQQNGFRLNEVLGARVNLYIALKLDKDVRDWRSMMRI